MVTDLVALAHNRRIPDKIDKLVVAESQAAISPETLSRSIKSYQIRDVPSKRSILAQHAAFDSPLGVFAINHHIPCLVSKRVA